jgi:lipopolysaccharide export LptBFGC system permease protein LptF
VPLGLRRVRGARAAGAMVCVALVFAYYALLSLAEFLGSKTPVPPSLAMWIPNAVFLLLALPLLWRARRGEL